MTNPTDTPENTDARPGLTARRLPGYMNDVAATLALCAHSAAAETLNIHKLCNELEITLAIENIEHDSDAATLLATQARVLDALFHFFARKGLESEIRGNDSNDAMNHSLRAQRQCAITVDKLKRNAARQEKPASELKEY